MALNYRLQVLGPFRVPTMRRRGRRRIDFDLARDAVFEAAQEAVGGRYDLYDAIGCYIFGLSPRGARTWPYYVGKACDQTLHKRVFQSQDKPRLYDDILSEYDRATPFVYLLPLLTPAGNLARLKSNGRRIQLAEQTLIGMALRVNPDLWNIQHRAALDSFTIDGISASRGRQSEAAARLRTMLDRPPPAKMRSSASDTPPPTILSEPQPETLTDDR